MTRERLIEAAHDLFSSGGIEATTIDRIAEHAGYSRGAFYSNFETKDEILAAVADRESARSREDFAKMAAENTTPEEKLNALRNFAIDMCLDRKGCMFYLEMEMYGVRNNSSRKMIADFVGQDTHTGARFLDALFKEFHVTNAPSTELIVSSFISMAQGLTMRQIVEPDSMPETVVRESLALYFDSVITSCIPQLRKSPPCTDEAPTNAGKGRL
ncbi:MAG: TetR/AcrR family transcriptional regulator [Bryobacteraceae bacterium]|nr:TetR/AcrR family transcriptional regulator [Bryobacteraceae bacterium]